MLENGENNRQMLIDDATGRKILDAAIRIIDEEGYDNLTIRRVAKESGCSNTAIYMRFADKDALAREVAALRAKPFFRMVEENYVAGDEISQNVSRIARAQLDKVYEMDLEAIRMQILYLGGLKKEENHLLLKIAEYLKAAADKGLVRSGNYMDMAFSMYASFWGLAYMLRSMTAFLARRHIAC